MAEPKKIFKRGDKVGSTQNEGIFEIVCVNSLMHMANLKAVDGSSPVIPDVPWTALNILDED